MRKEVLKEYERIEKLIGVKITDQVLKETVSAALAKMMRQGLPKACLERILKSARPLGDFAYFQGLMTTEEFDEFFSGPVRKFGLDGSLDFKYSGYGASTLAEMHNISPWGCNIDTYESMRGKPSKSDPDKEDIFFSGHAIEPVYRSYFNRMYGDRYIVIECDIQWASRKYDHFIGNLDGVLYDRETGKLGVLEIKHTSPRNVRVIDSVKSGVVPEYWDIQERAYMEMIDADFSCLFLGWGNRVGLDTNAMARIERDEALGKTILEEAEEFMTSNVEAGVKPSFRGVKATELIKKSLEELYGPVNPHKSVVKLSKTVLASLEALTEAEEAIKKAKEQESLATDEVKLAEAHYEALSIPIIEELKDAPRGEYVTSDGLHYEVTYDVRNALDVEKVKAEFPVAYDACNKPQVDTAKLKRSYPEVYTECFGPKIGSKRSFKMRKWEERK